MRAASKTACLGLTFSLHLLAALFIPAERAPAAPGDIVRCSADGAGVPGNDGSGSPSLSADGRYAAFDSYADNLVAGDTNGARDVFRKDLETGGILRCSTGAAGTEGNGHSRYPSISADGRYVAFESEADGLVPGDTNGTADVFRKDLETGGILRCSTGAAGTEGDGGSYWPAISADGRYVAFESAAGNLVPGDTNGARDIFRKDLETGEVLRCSTSSSGAEGDKGSFRPAVSADGRYVAFQSAAGNLVPGDGNGFLDVFRKDLQSGEILRCSVGAAGEEADNVSAWPDLSADGRYAAFESAAGNLVPGDNRGARDVFRKDLETGGILRCSTDAAGTEGDGGSYWPSLSADGRYAAFYSNAPNLVTGDDNQRCDVFRKDLETGGILRCSTDAAGTEGDGDSYWPSLSADGAFVAFQSNAANLVPGGTSGKDDVFRKEPSSTAPGKVTFYFAEGYTGSGFAEFLCLARQEPSPVTVTVTYLFRDGTSRAASYLVPAQSRYTVDVNAAVGAGREVSIKCEADSAFAAERPMYFNYGGAWSGGHAVVGTTRTSTAWYFAEGYTGHGFEEWICVLNPGGERADITFRFQTQEEGEKAVFGLSVPALSRGSFKVNDLLGGGSYQNSLYLQSTRPVVAERSMYFNYTGANNRHWTGGHCVVGAPELATDYFFAEGCTRAGFEEWLTIQNPWDREIIVRATYLLAEGEPVERDYRVEAGRRFTRFVQDEVGEGRDVSIHLSCPSPFLAERPMYFSYGGTGGFGWTGGHCVIGATSPANVWLFAEGYTGPGFEEWLCIQNPGDSRASVTVTYYPQGGSPMVKAPFTVKAGSRHTVPVNAHAGPGLSIAARVVSDQPVIVERPMYFSYGPQGWTGGHDVLGFPQ